MWDGKGRSLQKSSLLKCKSQCQLECRLQSLCPPFYPVCLVCAGVSIPYFMGCKMLPVVRGTRPPGPLKKREEEGASLAIIGCEPHSV